MKNRYKNLWFKSLNRTAPEYYENNARKVGEHRGVLVFMLFERGYDFVFNGACITQRAGITKFKDVIDGIMDGKEPVSTEVAKHLKSFNVPALDWNDAN